MGRLIVFFASLFFCAVMLSEPARAENRLALVVGVSDYGPQSLTNPVNDARRIDAALTSAGFTTTALFNPSRGQLREAVNLLAAEAARSGRDTTIAFFFAGHAVQFNGENWLIPSRADIFEGVPSVANFEDGTVRAQWVLDRLSETGVARILMVLDACRTNPFRADRRSVAEGDGLAKMSTLPGGPDTMIVFAAEPRYAAFDGTTGNSPFSKAFAEIILVPGLDIADAFTAVRERVRLETRDRQRPHVEGLFPFQFKPGPPINAVASQMGIAPARVQSAEDGWALLHETMRTKSIEELQTAAAQDGLAMYLLGLATWDGLYGVQKNPLDAQRLMRRAVARGVGRAANSLGYFSCCSDELPKNPTEAAEWFRIGMELGSVAAISNLGVQYRDGQGVPKDRAEAERLFNLAAERGSSLGLFNLGLLYDGPRFGTNDPARALAFYQRAYDGGHRDSAINLSNAYRFGTHGVAQDLKRALEILEQGGEAGCKTCWYIAGALVAGDELGAADPARAYRYFRRGADMGDPDSIMEAARALQKGKGVAEDDAEAFKLFEQAAAAGSNEAFGSMGQALAKGEGVRRDTERAARLLSQVLAMENDPDLDRRHSVYEPNYWGYGRALAELHETRAIAGASAEEAERLRARYGSEANSGMKRFTVPINCGEVRQKFHIYVVNWDRKDDETIEGQVAWLAHSRGCVVPTDVVDSFRKLKKIARENNVSFIDLCVYALGAAQQPSPAPAAASASTEPNSIAPGGATAPVAALTFRPSPEAANAPPPPTITDSALLQEKGVILLNGRNTQGDPIYTYLELTLARLIDLRNAMRAQQDFNPSDYGRVLAAGKGEPLEDVRRRMAEEHNMVDVPRPQQGEAPPASGQAPR